MAVLNYFETNYLGLCDCASDFRVTPKFDINLWNYYDNAMKDPEFPRTSNMVEGFHRGFETRVNRAKPSVQEYYRAVREQQVTTDFHLDRLARNITPSKKRKTTNNDLREICCAFASYPCTLDYMFDIAEYFGHKV